jgi:Uma2 family endonuclease
MQTHARTYTPEEYLALEETAEFRSEYHDGEITPMTGGSISHNRIVRNLIAFLTFALRGKNFEPFTSDLRLWIPRYRRFTYPDIFVIQGSPILYANRTDTVTNPTLIVEVLSKSTQDYDRTDKFRYYRSLPDLQEYVLINQYEIQIEQFTKTPEGLWLLRDYEADSETLRFASVDVEMKIAELYAGVDFSLPPDSDTSEAEPE